MRTSVRVPVAVTDFDALTVGVEAFDFMLLALSVTVADEVLEVVEL